MVLDTDAYNDVDDQFALAYALLSEEKLELEAVYAAPFKHKFSESPADGMEKSYQEILKILKMLDKTADNFAFRGSGGYLEDISNPIYSDAALDIIERALASRPDDPLYITALGCITNVASAILIEPQIIKNIVVIWLAGNDLNWEDQQEFNLRQDILASQVILNSGVPLVIVPCMPVASHLITSLPELEKYLKGKNTLADYLYNTVEEYSEGRLAYSKVLWDVSAIAWLVNPSWIRTRLIHCPVLTDQLTYKLDESRHLIRMAIFTDRDEIFRDLFRKLAE